jgi:hypothetical protein
MRKAGFGAALALCAIATPMRAEPANSLRELSAQLGQCLTAPGDGEVTLRLSLRRDGALLGKTHITYSKLPADEEKKRRVLEGIAVAVDGCLPAKITDALGGAIAGRPLVLRFAPKKRETNI